MTTEGYQPSWKGLNASFLREVGESLQKAKGKLSPRRFASLGRCSEPDGGFRERA